MDLETGAVVAVTVQPADRGDPQSLEATLEETLENLAVVVEQVELPEQVLTEVGSRTAGITARPRWRAHTSSACAAILLSPSIPVAAGAAGRPSKKSLTQITGE